MAARWPQDGPKMAPRGLRDASETKSKIQAGLKMAQVASKSLASRSQKSSYIIRAPKRRPRRPRSPQEAPKSSREAPKRPPRGPQEAPKRPAKGAQAARVAAQTADSMKRGQPRSQPRPLVQCMVLATHAALASGNRLGDQSAVRCYKAESHRQYVLNICVYVLESAAP